MSTLIQTRPVGRPRDADATTVILEATLRLLAKHGYRGMSTAAVAAAARASKATVYRRWPSKFALVAAAIEHGLHAAHAGPLLTGDVREDLARTLEAKMRALSEGPLGGAVRAVISHAAHEPELSQALAQVAAAAREQGPLRPLVEEAVRQGLTPPGADVGLLLDLLLGAPFFQLLVQQAAPDPAAARPLVALLFHSR